MRVKRKGKREDEELEGISDTDGEERLPARRDKIESLPEPIVTKFFHGDGIGSVLQRYIDGGIIYDRNKFIEAIGEYFKLLDTGVLEVVSQGRVVKLMGKKACSLEGLCAFLGISRDVWDKYENDERFTDFWEVAKFAKTVISQRLIEGSLEGLYNSNLAKFYMKNISSLKEEGAADSHRIGNITVQIVKTDNQLSVKEGARTIEAEVIEDV